MNDEIKQRIKIAVVLFLGVVLLTYPPAAQWFDQLEKSRLIDTFHLEVDAEAEAFKARELELSRAYNSTLGEGTAFDPFTQKLVTVDGDAYREYEKRLVNLPSKVMARVKVPSLGIDLPVYHGTDEDTLLSGIGHLYGTALPVGGEGTHSVLTAHSGLASARFFTDLPKVADGELVHVDVLGETLTYKIYHREEVLPHETEFLVAQPNKDLLTLVTCTPVGVNSHRLLVTAERVPTPEEVIPLLNDQPGFPWWSFILGGAAVVLGGYVYAGRRQQASADATSHAPPGGAVRGGQKRSARP